MFSLNNKAQLHRCDVGNLPSRAGSVWLGSAFLLLHGARRWLPARAALAQDQTRRISGSLPLLEPDPIPPEPPGLGRGVWGRAAQRR